jgi:DNA-binding NtrC family response regulator
MQTILIVEDKESMALMLKETLEAEGYRAITAADGQEGVRKIKGEATDMVITDLKLPGKDGIGVLKASMEENPLRPVIVMTAFGSVETAVEAMKEGAFDFVQKPFNVDHLLMLIKRALENQRLVTENMLLKEEFSSRLGLPDIIGKSDAIADVADKIKKAAPAKTTILLIGESGTGKELFARAIHHLSGRRDYPFVPINCAAIPRELIESELFGFEKGAFTGAESRRLGKFELAHKGTVFLDEIGELDMGLQAKLLRAVQEEEIERIGSEKSIKIDVRVVAASNKDLERAMEDGAFREDLFYRLNVFPIVIPPLRERKEDVPLLADYFIKKYSGELKSAVKGVSDDAMELMVDYGWKGNVRELENTIERAIILCDGKTITPEHISLSPGRTYSSSIGMPMEGTLEEVAKKALRAAESGRIRIALKDSDGNKTRAADMLRVSYKTLLTKIKEYDIR